jgi:hypothetical protein
MINHHATRRILLGSILAVALGACVPAQWVKIEAENRTASNRTFQVNLPVGWMHANRLNRVYYVKMERYNAPIPVDRITATRDGFPLQDMDFIRFDAKYAWPHLRKAYTSNMLPSEAADLWVADLKQSGLASLKVHSNEPAQIAGNVGFKLHVSYKNARGLQIERLIYGFGHQSGFYILNYEAPSLHYFPENRNAFIEAVNSFKLAS